jgi:hypothetical protein
MDISTNAAYSACLQLSLISDLQHKHDIRLPE